ncbi:MAG: hypothetical protein [Wendovervirus sonii]|uniref:Uncharacterized protein n=1 Tax=phage Lak_Megaphage_Sonny TaxID=3109229 RepID=A0ABZ0Z3M9_9CAUD|nr:MAG: hypothetical protein [phage Lak_Megaphage_Sonny]
METTQNPQYGHFIVRESYITEPVLGFGYSLGMCSVTNKTKYGVFKINHAKYSYEIENCENPVKAYKVDLEPMDSENFIRRDFYAIDVFSQFDYAHCNVKIFDNFEEAQDYANEMNRLK